MFKMSIFGYPFCQQYVLPFLIQLTKIVVDCPSPQTIFAGFFSAPFFGLFGSFKVPVFVVPNVLDVMVFPDRVKDSILPFVSQVSCVSVDREHSVVSPFCASSIHVPT